MAAPSPACCCEFFEIGAANFPRIEQQAGAGEHVAGEELRVTAFEDVAVFIADLASGGVEVRILAGVPEAAPKRAKPPRPPKRPLPGSNRDAATWTRANGLLWASLTVMKSLSFSMLAMCSGDCL
jgi:hypothetical protein